MIVELYEDLFEPRRGVMDFLNHIIPSGFRLVFL